ncbi:MAG TPA: hypothetical protein VEU32_15445 [Burkholderiales bacterium]|nr:hypothetical protein [Burkholderiales bacterium]
MRCLLALAFCSVTLCHAADPEAVARPQVKPGDSWTYRRMDYWTNRPTGHLRETVTFANDKVIIAVGQRGDKEKELDATYTAEWNFVSSPTGRVFNPDQGLFRFPMHPGDAHDWKYDMKDPTEGAFEVRFERHVKVVGREDVQVPAGNAIETAWYAPEAKRFVKWTFENSTARGRNLWWGIELLEYKVQ